MAFNKLGEAFVDIYLKDRTFKRNLRNVGNTFTKSMSKVIANSEKAASSGLGALAAALKGTERQIKSVSSASSRMFSSMGKSASTVGDALSKSTAKKIKLRADDKAFRQKISQAASHHRFNMNAMANRSRLKIKLADREYRSKLKRLASDTNRSTHTMRNAFAGVLAGIGVTRMLGSARRGFTDLISTGFAFNSQLQQMQTSMTQMLGSAAAADKVIEGIRGFSESTPFQIGDLTSASVALLSTRKIAEDQLLPTLQKLGDAAAGSAEGFAAMPRITRAITQSLSKGKLQAEEMLQLAEAGIPAWDALSQATGKTTAELQKMGERGELGADMVLKLIDGLGARFEGLAAKQAKTWGGLWSTFSDKARSAIGQVTKPLFEIATINLGKVIEFLDSDKAKGFIKAITGGVAKIAKLIQAAINSPVAMAIAKFAALAGGVSAVASAFAIAASMAATFFGPFIPAIAAIAAGVSALTAAVMGIAASFRTALASDRGQQIIANLSRIKDLAIEIGANLRDAIGRGLEFVSSKLSALFGGDAADKAGEFWESVTSKMAAFLDAISLLTTDFGKTWELFKTSAAISLATVWERTKFLFGTQIPNILAALGNAAVGGFISIGDNIGTIFSAVFDLMRTVFENNVKGMANIVTGLLNAAQVLGEGWKDVWHGVVAFAEKAFKGFIDAQSARIKGIASAMKLAASLRFGSAAKALASAEYEAATIKVNAAKEAAAAFNEHAGGVVSEAGQKIKDAFNTLPGIIGENLLAADKFGQTMSKVLAEAGTEMGKRFNAVREQQADFVVPDYIRTLQEYQNSIMDGIAAMREQNRANRDAESAVAAVIESHKKLKAATEELASAEKMKAAADAAAAGAKVGPKLSGEQLKEADELKKRFRSAADVLKEEVARISTLFERGAISAEIRDKAIAEAVEDADKKDDRGSQSFQISTPKEMYQRLQEAVLGGNVEDKQLDELKKIADAVQKENKGKLAIADFAAMAKEKIGNVRNAFDALRNFKFRDIIPNLRGDSKKQIDSANAVTDANAKVAKAAEEHATNLRKAGVHVKSADKETADKLAKQFQEFKAANPIDVNEPPAVMPEVVQPPAVMPEVVQPPAVMPEVVQPPAVMPEVVQPPAVMPEVVQPPAVMPEVAPRFSDSNLPTVSLVPEVEVNPPIVTNAWGDAATAINLASDAVKGFSVELRNLEMPTVKFQQTEASSPMRPIGEQFAGMQFEQPSIFPPYPMNAETIRPPDLSMPGPPRVSRSMYEDFNKTDDKSAKQTAANTAKIASLLERKSTAQEGYVTFSGGSYNV